MSVKVEYCTVEERDMDTLFLEAFASDKGFLKLFTDKVEVLKDNDSLNVVNVELSKSDNDGELDIANNPDYAGAGGWVHYRVKLSHAYILHKAERGFMDLTFSGAEEKKASIFELMESKIHQLGFENVKCFATGKAMSYRINVPIIDFDKPFDECNKADLNICFEAAKQLTELAKIISYFGEMCNR